MKFIIYIILLLAGALSIYKACIEKPIEKGKTKPWKLSIIIEALLFLAAIFLFPSSQNESDIKAIKNGTESMNCRMDSLYILMNKIANNPGESLYQDDAISVADCILYYDLMKSAMDSAMVAMAKARYTNAILHLGYLINFSEEDSLLLQAHFYTGFAFSAWADSLNERGFSDMEVAHFLNISMDSVRKIEKKSVQKLRESRVIKEIIP